MCGARASRCVGTPWRLRRRLLTRVFSRCWSGCGDHGRYGTTLAKGPWDDSFAKTRCAAGSATDRSTGRPQSISRRHCRAASAVAETDPTLRPGASPAPGREGHPARPDGRLRFKHESAPTVGSSSTSILEQAARSGLRSPARPDDRRGVRGSDFKRTRPAGAGCLPAKPRTCCPTPAT